MSQPASDRNLLFGILALQMDFISRDALVAAMHAWVMDKSRPLGQILTEQQALGAQRHALLEALVQEHLAQHGHDAAQSLAALSTLGSTREDLSQVADPAVQASLAHVSRDRPADEARATVLGSLGASPSAGRRFRILRPHARGGLGQVSVALDEELHREVALKEIQERHADDPASRARFLLEAEITGGLEHPGIVPVYSLGTYADGRPYYAMRLVRGDSLQHALERFHQAEGPRRDPAERNLMLRELLGRFVDVCNAVAYAHSRGVLHRDLKPSNILLGPFGETLLVDWGLAKTAAQTDVTIPPEGRLTPASASDSSPTVLGTALGTPSYMSPEQAGGQVDQMGPATDVYGLGATLYTLLTGKVPFVPGMGDLLLRVQAGLFPPPRQVNRSVPAALEAICLKAMALRPEERYARARDLAQDVEHWLADEPVSVYREPLRARLGRWTRRHRTLVSSVAVLFVTAAAALTGGLLLLGVEQARTEEQRQLALQTLKEVILDIQKGLENRPGMNDLRRKLLLRARKGLDKVGRSAETSRQIDHGRAWVCFQMGDLFDAEGDTASAQQQYGEGHRIAQALAQANPGDPEAQHDLRVSYSKLGDVHLRLGESQAALEAYTRGLEITQALAEADPQDALAQHNLSLCYNNVGDVHLQRGDNKAALEAYTRGQATAQTLTQADPRDAEAQRNLGVSCGKLGDVHLRLGDNQAALEAYTRGLATAQALAEADPRDAQAQRDLSASYNNIGDVHLEQDDSAAALKAYTRGLEIAQALAQADPKDAQAQRDLAVCCHNLGDAQLHLGNQQAALEAYQQGAAINQKLAQAHPEDAEAQRNLSASYNSVGDVQLKQGDRQAALQTYTRGLEILQALAQAHPNDPETQRNLSVSYNNIGDVQLRAGASKAALEAYRKGLALARALAQAHPEDAEAQRALRVSHEKFGDVQLQLGDSQAALEAYNKSLVIAQELAQADPKDADAQADLGVCHEKLGDVHLQRGESKAALQAYRQSLTIRRKLVQSHPRDADVRSDLGASLNKLAWALATCAEPQFREGAEAVVLAQQAVNLTPESGLYHRALGVCQYRAGNEKAAVASLEKAIQLNKAGTGSDWFFLAMAHHRLGHKEQARSCYDQAVQWMDKNKPQDPELRRFQAEAAALLGVQPKPGANDSSPR